MNIGVNNYFDLKVGYSCNNKCFHCVVEPSRLSLVDNNSKINQSYKDIIDVINSDECKSSSMITITGGEPTLRKDFARIIKYITDNYPKKSINIQTNGRLLAPHLEYFKTLSDSIAYTIAMHSKDEILHNKIVNCGDNESGNAYRETLATLETLKNVYGDFKSVARIEIVLSSLNYKTIPDTLEWLLSNGYNAVGLSYPHLDGFYEYFGKEKVKEIGISYTQLKEILPQLHKIAKEYPECDILFEEMPLCMWRDEDNNLLETLKNIRAMKLKGDSVFVKFIDKDLFKFNETWDDMHMHTKKCAFCACKNSCEGVWYESVEAFGEDGFMPITEAEYLKLRGEQNVLS